MTIPLWVVAAIALGAGPDPDLVAAQRLFDRAHYQEVLPILRRALARPLPRLERRDALVLQAMTQAAFGDAGAAIESFREVLGLDPEYEPGPISPKVRELFDEAQRRGAVVPRSQAEPIRDVPESGAAKETAHEESPTSPGLSLVTPPPKSGSSSTSVGIISRWWFWAAIGAAVVVVSGATAFAVTRPSIPSGNLPTGALR